MGNCFRRQVQPETNSLSQTHASDFWSFREDCCICMENPVQTAILNCGHTVLCKKCALMLKRSNMPNLNKCPICRSHIEDIVCFIPKNISY